MKVKLNPNINMLNTSSNMHNSNNANNINSPNPYFNSSNNNMNEKWKGHVILKEGKLNVSFQ